MTRILGIDPGLRITGFGVLDKAGHRLSYVTSGCIRTPRGELALRLKIIFDGLKEVIAECRPEQIALEKIFVNANPQTTLLLGQARGTAICAAVVHQLPVAEYTALQVKQAVVGNGHARKEQVQEMVKRLLALSGVPTQLSAPTPWENSAASSPCSHVKTGTPATPVPRFGSSDFSVTQ